MALTPPSITIGGVEKPWQPERILSYGGYGAGKTQQWLSIADLAQSAGGDEHFYVADADSAVIRSMCGDFSHLTNVTVTPMTHFRDYAQWAYDLQKMVKPGDWVVPDTSSSAYGEAIDYFLKKKYGSSRADFELEKMLDPDHKGPPIEPSDWVMIRSLFLNWWENMVVRELSDKLRCHVFTTAEAKQMMEHYEKKRNDKSDLIDYGEIGFRPDGHRSLPHKVHTVGFSQRSATKWFFTPVKDRQRPLKTITVNNFAVDYLMQVAGWTVN